MSFIQIPTDLHTMESYSIKEDNKQETSMKTIVDANVESDEETGAETDENIDIDVKTVMDMDMDTDADTDPDTDPDTEVVYGYNSKTDDWHCTLCGISMGRNNPRQLCRKTYCDN